MYHFDQADRAFAAYDATPWWKFITRWRLKRDAHTLAAMAFFSAGDVKAGNLMLGR